MPELDLNTDELVAEESFCIWTERDEGAYWETGCGDSFTIISGLPSENNMIYCTFCGKTIKEVPIQDEEEEEEDAD